MLLGFYITLKVSGKPLFIAPRGRTFEEFKAESISHGWPSFRDQEVCECEQTRIHTKTVIRIGML